MVLGYFKTVEKILFPCKYIGCTVSAFKSIAEIKKSDSKSLTNFFSKKGGKTADLNLKVKKLDHKRGLD